MGKKIALISFEVLFLGLCLWIVLQSTSLFIYATDRAITIIDFENVRAFFELTNDEILMGYLWEIYEKISGIIKYIFDLDISIFKKVVRLLEALWNFLLDFIIYFCNFGLNIVLIIGIILHETFTKEELEIKTTKGAKVYLWIQSQKVRFWTFFKGKMIKLWSYIRLKKRPILFHIFLILVSNGYAYLFLVEFIIFLEVYIIRLIDLEMYNMVFSIFKYLFVELYPIIKDTPKFVLILSLIILVFVSALSRASFKLKKNHERLKHFVREDITQTTFINGPPGSGKTLVNSSLTLIAEENYIDEFEENMRNYQINYPEYNFATVRKQLTKDHPQYFRNYDMLVNRESYITSNYSIYTPYFLRYSKIFDFNWMRKNKKVDRYPLEEYIVISISELDKEYNSHDDMKAVGEDGAATFFSTVSHDLKRHVKIFCDYQLKDQVPLRIRGNSEFFYTIESRKKKYPILLYVYYLPFIGLRKMLMNFISKYETKKKTINKKTQRIGPAKFKRNDYSFIYSFLRHNLKVIDKICKWFDHFWYFRITGNLSYQDGVKGDKKNLNLNLCDLEINDQKLYDSTFLSFAYESKKNFEFRKLDTFTSLTPSVEELTKCNSRFYNKINNISSPEHKEKEDDYVDL